MLQGLLTMCCFSQLSLLTEQLNHLIRIDPFVVFPREVSLKILGYLDATSLCRAAQVARRWKMLADDDTLWRGICEQHIGQKCKKCGWGLPILEKNRAYRLRSSSPCPASLLGSPVSSVSPPVLSKRKGEESTSLLLRPVKRPRTKSSRCAQYVQSDLDSDIDSSSALVAPTSPEALDKPSITRPWKDVYSERMTVERNWRRGRCTVRVLKGHTDGVMCLQFNENLSHPAFPVLITGSYDRTVRVWNLETGAELHCLRGHTRAVRCLQFDEAKLITGSMDNTIKVWDWRRGKCIRTLAGHTDGVVCVNFDLNLLASGSVDSTIRVWNVRSGGSFVLRGHSEWVNAVQLSDDGTIKLWDLSLRACIRQFTGHVGQVQCIKLLHSEERGETNHEAEDTETSGPHFPGEQQLQSGEHQSYDRRDRSKPLLISGSLDNTVKIWDIHSAKAIRTFFGHIEGVWSVACDKLRLVSGSHDRTIKVRLSLLVLVLGLI